MAKKDKKDKKEKGLKGPKTSGKIRVQDVRFAIAGAVAEKLIDRGAADWLCDQLGVETTSGTIARLRSYAISNTNDEGETRFGALGQG